MLGKFAEGKAEGLAEGKAEGLAEGKANTMKKMIKNMLEAGMDIIQITKITNTSEQEIKKIIEIN
ncbi:MAG: hypothetical protein QG673_851 [Pseudomonadota bacterium]|nr:hypothetical protein [Pseudomonadota bacterium]